MERGSAGEGEAVNESVIYYITVKYDVRWHAWSDRKFKDKSLLI